MSSTKETTITLRAPECDEVTDSLPPREVFVSGGHVCAFCNGNGYYYHGYSLARRTRETCPVCRGAGMLNAVVTVVWEADKQQSDNSQR